MMNVVAYDSRPDKRLADALDFPYLESLESLLAASDIVTLHAPMAPTTQHMINAETIHVAFNSAEALERILVTTIQNIKAFESGRPMNVV